MKSPIPTSFVLLLLVLASVGLIAGMIGLLTWGTQQALPNLEHARQGVGVFGGLIMLGMLLHSFLGVLAGARYRRDRKTLNRIGLGGNALLLLGLLTLYGFTFWKVREMRAARQPGGPMEIAEDYR